MPSQQRNCMVCGMPMPRDLERDPRSLAHESSGDCVRTLVVRVRALEEAMQQHFISHGVEIRD